MTLAAWGAALRLARRDVSRNKGRSALIVALIGIPVLLVGVADIGYRTYQLTPTEKVTRQIGAADAGLQWSGNNHVQQGASGWLGPVSLGGSPDKDVPSTNAVAAMLPHGSRVIEERPDPNLIVFRTRAGLARSQLVGLDYRDPIAAGLLTQHAGRAPRSAGEVVLTTALARASGLHVGDVLHAQDPTRSFDIVGTVTDTSNQNDRTLYSMPSAVSRQQAASGLGLTAGVAEGLTWLARTPYPVTWAAARRANRAGLLVLSRSVYLHPDAAARAESARLTEQQEGSPSNTTVVATLALVVGMALLEIVLLAGPAFAVGAKRRRRDLALVAAGGGSPRDVRRIVLAGGIVLGVAAGVAGVVGAIVVSRVGLPLLRPHVARLPGSFNVHPGELLIVAGAGLLAAVLATLVPARAAARTDVVGALSGRPSSAAIRARVPVLAVVLAAVGIAVALVGAGAGGTSAALAILAGTALLEVAVIVCTPTLLVLIARLGRRLPLAGRMALRDAGRNRTAATPAVAAVMASVVGATSILIGVASIAGQQRRQYVPSLPTLSMVTDVPASAQGARTVAHDLAATLPTRSVGILDTPASTCRTVNASCSVESLVLHTPLDSGNIPPLVIDNGAAAAALFGTNAAQARAALRAGKAVVGRSSLLRGGGVRLDTASQPIRPNHYLAEGPTHTHDVPAVHIASGPRSVLVVVPTGVAAALGVRATPALAFARLRSAPSDAQQQAALSRLHRVLADPNVVTETGYHDPYAALELALVLVAVAIAVLAAVIATGLTNVDARADLTTLAAVGATPRVRRTLSTARAGVIAAIGSVVGVLAGFLAPAAWVYGSPDEVTALHLVVPWSDLLAVAVAVPVLAAAVAGAFTRSRLPVE